MDVSCRLQYVRLVNEGHCGVIHSLLQSVLHFFFFEWVAAGIITGVLNKWSR